MVDNHELQQPPAGDKTGEQPPQQPYEYPPQGPYEARRKQSSKKKWLLAAVALAAVLVLVAGAFVLFTQGNNDDSQDSRQTNGQQETGQQEQESAAPDPTPTTYKSSKLNLEFTHRKDWVVKEADDGEITLTSPRLTYTRTDGETVDGVFTLKMRVGVPEAMKSTIEKAAAVRDSEVIAYANPTEEQRQYTSVSYAGQKDVFNFFIVTSNTELEAGDEFAFALVLDSQFYLIAGGYGEDKDGTLSFDSVPAESMDSATLTQAIDIVESLKIY